MFAYSYFFLINIRHLKQTWNLHAATLNSKGHHPPKYKPDCIIIKLFLEQEASSPSRNTLNLNCYLGGVSACRVSGDAPVDPSIGKLDVADAQSPIQTVSGLPAVYWHSTTAPEPGDCWRRVPLGTAGYVNSVASLDFHNLMTTLYLRRN